jgi:hypothetical protein
MPRQPRFHAEGLLYHVMARGHDGQQVLSQRDSMRRGLLRKRVAESA